MSSPATKAQKTVLGYIDQWVEYRSWKSRIPGVQLAVYFDGEVQLSRAYGVADQGTGEVLRTDHLFRIASHSKFFTATAILQLAERGALRLDDTLDLYIPELADHPQFSNVTVGELLSHSSGITRDSNNGDYWQLMRPYPDAEGLIEMVNDGGAITAPHMAFKYSNVGYSLLGRVIEAASGHSYADYMEERVIAAAGLRNTGVEWDPERAQEYASGHTGLHTSHERTTIEAVDTRAFAPATGFYGTAEDLVKFAAAHFTGNETLLSERSKRLQRRPVWNASADKPGATQYGLGAIIDDVGGHRVYGHSGGFPGHITRTLFDPEQRVAISVLTNAIDGAAGEISDGVLRILDGALYAPSQLSFEAPAPTTDVDMARFTGRFSNLWGVMDVALIGDRLLALAPGGASPLEEPDVLSVVDEATLKIESGGGFGSVGELMKFEFAADGSIVSVRAGGGMTMLPFKV